MTKQNCAKVMGTTWTSLDGTRGLTNTNVPLSVYRTTVQYVSERDPHWSGCAGEGERKAWQLWTENPEWPTPAWRKLVENTDTSVRVLEHLWSNVRTDTERKSIETTLRCLWKQQQEYGELFLALVYPADFSDVDTSVCFKQKVE